MCVSVCVCVCVCVWVVWCVCVCLSYAKCYPGKILIDCQRIKLSKLRIKRLRSTIKKRKSKMIANSASQPLLSTHIHTPQITITNSHIIYNFPIKSATLSPPTTNTPSQHCSNLRSQENMIILPEPKLTDNMRGTDIPHGPGWPLQRDPNCLAQRHPDAA